MSDTEANAIAMCVGTAALLIRKSATDPKEREAIARRMGKIMVEVVNDPTFSPQHP